MSTADLVRLSRNPFERLFDALIDPARRERVAVFVLGSYAAVWWFYGVVAKEGSQDIHVDMAELVAWSRAPALGYDKHPPFAAWMVKAWFTFFPVTDWSYYLLAMVTATLALWIAWRLSANYLAAEKRVLALALLTLVPFFNFHALKFNVNSVLLPLWAATAFAFLRSYERRSVSWAALAGLAAAAAMLGKYWSIFLLLGLVLAALLDSRRGAYFRSPAPWVAVLVGAVAITPHLYWLATHGFASFSYAVAVHGGETQITSAVSAFSYLAGAAAYVALPVVLTLVASRPDRAALKDVVWPAEPSRRLVALVFWGPLLLPVLIPLVAKIVIVSLWTMSAWTLLGIMLLSSPGVILTRRNGLRIFTFASVFPFIMAVASPAVAIATLRGDLPHVELSLSASLPRHKSEAAYASLLAGPLKRFWAEGTEKPLRVLGGDLTYRLAFYLRPAPSDLLWVGDRKKPAVDAASLARDGFAIVCNLENAPCIARAQALADHSAAARHTEITVARRFAGIDGPAAHFWILAVPPQQGGGQYR